MALGTAAKGEKWAVAIATPKPEFYNAFLTSHLGINLLLLMFMKINFNKKADKVLKTLVAIFIR
ncbi:hypothetical protein ASG99_06600 [Bacillus sp. Soil768D1]|nr:hypothetical protein ASG99_06600 [Bacillus sp. Soil768D1]